MWRYNWNFLICNVCVESSDANQTLLEPHNVKHKHLPFCQFPTLHSANNFYFLYTTPSLTLGSYYFQRIQYIIKDFGSRAQNFQNLPVLDGFRLFRTQIPKNYLFWMIYHSYTDFFGSFIPFHRCTLITIFIFLLVFPCQLACTGNNNGVCRMHFLVWGVK